MTTRVPLPPPSSKCNPKLARGNHTHIERPSFERKKEHHVAVSKALHQAGLGPNRNAAFKVSKAHKRENAGKSILKAKIWPGSCFSFPLHLSS
jgi:hypothetical protein